jgi:hypothetical protein
MNRLLAAAPISVRKQSKFFELFVKTVDLNNLKISIFMSTVFTLRANRSQHIACVTVQSL